MNYKLDEFNNKKIVCVGDKKISQDIISFLNKSVATGPVQFIEYSNNSTDFKQLQTLDFTQYIVIKTENVPGNLIPAPYTTPTKIFFNCVKQLGAKTVGVTGTKGKTTTASLIAAMLYEKGLPVVLTGNTDSSLVNSLEQATKDSVFVVELSSYLLAELEVSPDIAVITNLYKDHIDYHGSLDKYWEAKRNIMRYMSNGGKVVFSPRYEMILHWFAESEAQQVHVNSDEAVDMTKSLLIGEHNKQNFILAKTAAQLLGCDKFTALNVLSNFKPIRHRLEKVRTVKGITFVDDAIASQPEATVAGITACVREVAPVGCVMLGGQNKDYDYADLVKILSTLLVPCLVLFPDTGAIIKDLLPEAYKPKILESKDMVEAVNWVSNNCPSGSVCLLSTASPSVSVWKNYEEKGTLFQDAVNMLSN